ncbi:hypothetical protein EYR36_010679 [Pleurotus pulmonarius]|nr:hypothetical protein EYR36_010679 [Pleurotus pulmonarius]
MPRRNSSTTTKAPRKRPWATRAQKDFLRSMTQAFHDTMDDEFGRKRFWADVREEWLSRWDLTDKQNRNLSSYFRDAMRKRGAIPARVRQPKKAARPPLAATTRHQARQAEEPESTQDSSEAIEEFQSSSPLFSRSPMPGPSRVPRPPTPPTLASHSPTPGPSRVPRPLTPPTLAKSPSVPSSPAPLKRAPGAVTVLPPSLIWTKEANHVHCGLEDGVLRVLIKVMCLENITDEREVFSVDDMLPW